MGLQTVVESVLRRIIPRDAAIVVAVSGGADSLALLHALANARLPFRLHAATLDHGLRGEAGAADARFVAEMSQARGIPVTVGQISAEEWQHMATGIEERARALRYDFLARTAAEIGTTWIATAHHAGDQAETVLMRLLRGAGLRGLGGISPVAPVPGYKSLRLVRPMLAITRAEIEAYCREHHLQPRHDATNDDTAYLRNRIRHTVLPLLREINPQVERSLLQLADIAALEDDFIEQELQRHLQPPDVVRAGEAVMLRRAWFKALHPALQRRAIAWAVAQIASGERETGYGHVTHAVEVALSGGVGAWALLPGGLHLRVDYETLVIEPTSPLHEGEGVGVRAFLLPTDFEQAIDIPGTTDLPGGWRLIVSLTEIPHHARLSLPTDAAVMLRARREGDRFAPLGMGGHTQKLSRWMINRKIPQRMRDHLLLLVVNGEVAAILVGDQWPIAETFAVRPGISQQVMYLILNSP